MFAAQLIAFHETPAYSHHIVQRLELTLMIVLRLLCVFAAGIVMILSPVVIDPNGHGLPTWKALLALAGIILTAFSFLYLAIVAPRLRRDWNKRLRAAGLLAIPIVVASAMLATQQDPMTLSCSGLLLGATILLLLGVLFPQALGKPERRRRVQSEAVAGG
jgi:hypothetical protein